MSSPVPVVLATAQNVVNEIEQVNDVTAKDKNLDQQLAVATSVIETVEEVDQVINPNNKLFSKLFACCYTSTVKK